MVTERDGGVVVRECSEVFRFDLDHRRPWKRHIILHQRLRHGLLHQQVNVWHLQDVHAHTERVLWSMNSAWTFIDAVTHPCSFLSQVELRREVSVLRGERDALEHTLLHLSDHKPDQHAERRTAHVQTGSVGEVLFEVIKCTWAHNEDRHKWSTAEASQL